MQIDVLMQTHGSSAMLTCGEAALAVIGYLPVLYQLFSRREAAVIRRTAMTRSSTYPPPNR